MARIIALDSGPLALAGKLNTKRPRPPERDPKLCRAWLAARKATGDRIIIPEVIDYEVRREQIRVAIQEGTIDPSGLEPHGRDPALVRVAASVRRLEALRVPYEFLPLISEDLERAAELWALLRSRDLGTVLHPAIWPPRDDAPHGIRGVCPHLVQGVFSPRMGRRLGSLGRGSPLRNTDLQLGLGSPRLLLQTP